MKEPEVEEEGQAEASQSKRKRIAKRNVLLWDEFIETDDKNVVLCNIYILVANKGSEGLMDQPPE
jgi:hypothetical protein